MSVKLTPDAKASLVEIAAYTQRQWGKKQCAIYLKMIDQSFHELNREPMKGKARPDIYHQLRSHPVGKHVVFYITKSDFIIIVNMLHEKMAPARHLHKRGN